MSQAQLIFSLYEIGAVQFGEFELKSGQISPIYINLRKIISYPAILREVAAAMWEATQKTTFDLVCGVPYTALPIATCVSLRFNVPMIMRRKEKKEYGTKQSIEGVFKNGQRCLVIEDVITTGGSLIETCAELEAAGLVVHDVIALIDREQGGHATLSERYQVHTLLTLSEMLHTLLDSSVIKPDERSAIQRYLASKP